MNKELKPYLKYDEINIENKRMRHGTYKCKKLYIWHENSSDSIASI